MPPKVNVFAWKLARDSLPTRQAKFVRNLERDNRCPLCDCEAETSFHATVSCPQAYALRQAMRQHWVLPDELQFRYTGPSWFLMLLDNCKPEQRDKVKLLLWRAWTTHNNITHQSGPTGIHDGVQALLAISASLEQAREEGGDKKLAHGTTSQTSPGQGRGKGKEAASRGAEARWQAPPAGWTKINVDGSFAVGSGDAGVGVVARNSSGDVLFTAWRTLFRCADAPEAEARACIEGIRLAAEWSPGPVIIEADCSRVVQAIRQGMDRSDIGFIVSEARELAQLLVDWKIVLVKRDCNAVANELAQLARRTAHTAVWLGRAPACVMDLITLDCTPTSQLIKLSLFSAKKKCVYVTIGQPNTS